MGSVVIPINPSAPILLALMHLSNPAPLEVEANYKCTSLNARGLSSVGRSTTAGGKVWLR